MTSDLPEVMHWVELNTKKYIYNLQHSPPDLESVLKVYSGWDTVMADQDVIVLILVIQDITHNQDEKMQSTMAYAEALFEFATTYHEPKQSNTDYYALLKSRRYMVTAHDRQPGYNPKTI